jgi:hypothetical protein
MKLTTPSPLRSAAPFHRTSPACALRLAARASSCVSPMRHGPVTKGSKPGVAVAVGTGDENVVPGGNGVGSEPAGSPGVAVAMGTGDENVVPGGNGVGSEPGGSPGVEVGVGASLFPSTMKSRLAPLPGQKIVNPWAVLFATTGVQKRFCGVTRTR